MKKLYPLLLCGLLSGIPAVASPRFVSQKAPAARHIVKKSPDAAKWLPEEQTEYFYEDGWIELGNVHFTYDSKGNSITELLTSDEGSFKTIYEYDDNNQRTSMLTLADEGGSWVNESWTTYTYDPIIQDYYILRMGYDWTDNAWIENIKCESNEIVRNDAGNIVSIVKNLPLGGAMVPAYKLEWTYDEQSGKAVGMTYYYYDSTKNTWVIYDATEYKNLTWEATDGQMTEVDINAFTEGPNRLTSCDVYYQGVIDGHFIVNYDANGGYTANHTFADPTVIGISNVKAFTDDLGSFTLTTYEYFDKKNNPTTEPEFIGRLRVVYNEHGDVTLETYSEVFEEGDEDILEGYKYDYTYDENGNVSEYVSHMYDYDTYQYIPENKIVFHSYTKISGIENVAVDTDAAAEYFDMQGRRVANPTNGIYIKRQGGKATKIKL